MGGYDGEDWVGREMGFGGKRGAWGHTGSGVDFQDEALLTPKGRTR